jgi:radical SAM superfamily enzyme YgiQ (UPF0313 family)
MDILLLSQDETHPFYDGINAYFAVPLLDAAGPRELFTTPPLGLTLLATRLNQLGFETAAVHNFFTMEESRRRLAAGLEARPLAVGISTTHTFRPDYVSEIVALTKRLSPDSVIITGGPGVEWNEALRPAGSVTVLGPGENTLPLLLSALRAKADLSGIPNLSYFKDGARVETPRLDNAPLASVPEPDWGIYPAPPARVLVQGSRGCARACGFCAYSGPADARTPAAVLSEINANRRKWNINFFRLTDSDFAADPARALELCRGLERAGGYSWTCFARADSLLAPGLLDAMKRAGCLWVFLGIESGSDKILGAMNKGCSSAVMKDAVKKIKAAGIGTHGNFVVGYPGETAATIAESLDFALTSGLDTVYYSPFQIRSRAIPAYRDRAGLGLEETGAGWRHASMSSEETLSRTLELMDATRRAPGAPLLTSEALFSLFSKGEGGVFRSNVFEFFSAVRDWHGCRLAGDTAGLQKARAVIRSHF